MNRHELPRACHLAYICRRFGREAAHGATLLPTTDGFGYEFFPAPVSGVPFEAFLPVGVHPTGHSTRSALRFDLSGVGLTAAAVSSATLDLFVGDTTATNFGAFVSRPTDFGELVSRLERVPGMKPL